MNTGTIVQRSLLLRQVLVIA